MRSRIKTLLQRKNLELRSSPTSIRRASPRKAIVGFEWVTLCLINPDFLNEVASDLLETCDHGSRHFAANGRLVDLSEVSEMVREIRCYDLEKVEGSVAFGDARLAVNVVVTDVELCAITDEPERSVFVALLPEAAPKEKEQIVGARAKPHLRAPGHGIGALQSTPKLDGVAGASDISTV